MPIPIPRGFNAIAKSTPGAPSAGTWAVGDVIGDSAGVYWRCAAGGSPGTWEGFGAGRSVGMIDVRDYGAVGDGTTDDTTAIQNAINAAASATVQCYTVFFPAGRYRITAAITITGRNVLLRGAGRRVSELRIDTASAPNNVIKWDMATSVGAWGGMMDLSLVEDGTIDTINRYVWVANGSSARFHLDRVFMQGSCSIAMVDVESCNFLRIHATEIECFGGRILRLAGSNTRIVGARISDNVWRRRHAATPRASDTIGATVLIDGVGSSQCWSNCTIGGGGQEKVTACSGTASNASYYQFNFASHNFNVGDLVTVRGFTPTALNGTWRVTAVAATYIRVDNTANPGTASVIGRIGLPLACIHIESDAGSDTPVNETVWSNIICEGVSGSGTDDTGTAHAAGTNGDPGSVSLLVRASNVGCREISNHLFSNCFFDYGQTAVLAVGRQITAPAEWSIRNLQFANCYAQASRIAYDFLGVTQLSLTACNSQNVDANVLGGADGVAALRLQACYFVDISNCHLGMGAINTAAANAWNHGIQIDGTDRGDYITVCGGSIFGKHQQNGISQGIQNTHVSQTIKTSGVRALSGTSPSSVVAIPTIASATTIIVWGLYDCYQITGTTAITTINNGWIGREVKFYCASAVNFNTGGNISNAVAAGAGQLVVAVFDGSNWHLR